MYDPVEPGDQGEAGDGRGGPRVGGQGGSPRGLALGSAGVTLSRARSVLREEFTRGPEAGWRAGHREEVGSRASSPASMCRPCPWSWEFFQGSCYFFSRSKNNWKDSVSMCKDMDAHMVVVNSAAEQKFIESWDLREEKRTWIGLSDHHNEGSWQWVDGSPLALSFWRQGEPNNFGDEDCVELYKDGWNDGLCNFENAWICEMPSAPCPDP
ncbi:CD209 antigen [Galemys pyrenaicus]|uniref:CD209 antigen n=1 Tax=Galemys pyrenaicus TaxID=202257 RepID=A0A8J6AEF0_GALPY|nr:CD209 antigen [Galemys pyrenaicus]